MALRALECARDILPGIEFSHDALEAALRDAAKQAGMKTGQLFQPIRVAVCGRKTAPPLFGTLEALGKDTSLNRIRDAIEKLNAPPRTFAVGA
jgi:glutamyl/glutaminyl-tRNA synthetase